MGRLQFSTQLRVALLLPALVALAAAAIPFWRSLTGAVERSTGERLTNALVPIEHLLRPSLGLEARSLDDRLSEITDGTSLRITVIGERGVVLADSVRTWDQVLEMENHIGRPEIRQALTDGSGTSVRRSDTTGRDYVYSARLIHDAGGRPFVLRLAEPLDELVSARVYLARVVALATLAIAAVAALVSGLIARRLFRPLSQLVYAADRLTEAGDGYRIPIPATGELATLARSLNRMADRVQRQLTTSEGERRQLDDVLQSMTDGVLVTDREGTVRIANPSLCRLFGTSLEPAGRSVLEVTRQPRIEELANETLAEGSTQEVQVEVAAPTARTLVLASSPLSDGAGAVVVARDISESTRLHAMRRDFVANVSHELRTPLTAIRGYAETLRDGAIDDPGTAVRFTERILLQCRRLQAILDDLLTLSRLENADAVAEVQQVSLADILRDAAELMASKSVEKKVVVRIEADETRQILGDPTALERVCVNLLENAIKYNRPSGQVTGRVYSDDDDLILEVRDTGIGIPSDALSRVFERFYRVDKGRSRGEGGTGLGLAIVKHVAQLHAGRVEVDSQLGEGTRVRVIFPRRTAPPVDVAEL